VIRGSYYKYGLGLTGDS